MRFCQCDDVRFLKISKCKFRLILIDPRYDLHGGWENPQKTAIHGALYRSLLDPSNGNADYSIQLLLRNGVSKEKIIMGIP